MKRNTGRSLQQKMNKTYINVIIYILSSAFSGPRRVLLCFSLAQYLGIVQPVDFWPYHECTDLRFQRSREILGAPEM